MRCLTSPHSTLPCSGQIKSKLYGKFKLYWPDQAQYGEVGQADMDAWTAKAKELEVQLAELQARKKALQAQVSALSSELTAEELEAQLLENREAVTTLTARVEKLEGAGVPLVTPEERAAVKQSLERYRKLWAERKRMVMDVVDGMADGLEKRPREVCDMIGIETDENVGVNIKDFKI